MINKYTLEQLRKKIRNTHSKEELRELAKYIPTLTEQQREEGHKRLDDGIYDEDGTLIGEKSPDD